MILVTGATGLVGTYLLSELTRGNRKIRAMYRTQEKLDHTREVYLKLSASNTENSFQRIEWVQGDITDVVTLETAFTGITVVYHCAALISFDPADYSKLRKINIEGTANIVNQCVLHRVHTLCHISSIATLGESVSSQKINEKTEWNPEHKHSVYAITKYGAEMEVWRGSQEGLQVIIVNPGIIIGSGFFTSGSGYFFRRIAKGLSYYTPGISGYIAAEDVASCMTALVDKGIKNERYVLVAENWSFQQFFSTVANALNKPAPHKQASKIGMQLAVWYYNLRYLLTGKRRKLFNATVKSAFSESVYDNSKIVQELDYSFIPVDKAIQETADYFKKYYNVSNTK
ncbi:NAD-dependent epimerase/dehydratase family protein [Aquimarina sp. ERC-38]|uniref:NAD-dependent epimerase/dehydratase family protein n=1 Tax=Aquimarina sp. ERC-38 TaxID=2949996 RepID=UPI002247BDB0|nr:NAD-dependent epimerase/dehydratase family protein [Aquimarina sp. ERC-38]UZO81691.1 NAD-dependent epimerase/dehydratase family protein [Aquimarina sp. ERC-38]